MKFGANGDTRWPLLSRALFRILGERRIASKNERLAPS